MGYGVNHLDAEKTFASADNFPDGHRRSPKTYHSNYALGALNFSVVHVRVGLMRHVLLAGSAACCAALSARLQGFVATSQRSGYTLWSLT